MVVRRGDLCWVSLRPPVGSEPGYRRPVLIVSSDRFNRSRIATVTALVLTSKLRYAEAPGNVFLPADASGLARDSVVNVSQVVTVDKGDLEMTDSQMDPAFMGMVDHGLSLALGLPVGR